MLLTYVAQAVTSVIIFTNSEHILMIAQQLRLYLSTVVTTTKHTLQLLF